MARTKTERYRDCQDTWTRTTRQKVQEEFKTSSSSRLLQPSSKNIQQTNNILWSSAAGVSHMAVPSFFDPLAATSLDHLHTIVRVTYNNVQDMYNTLQNHLKTEQWKTVDKLNCKTMTTVKTVAYIVQWVHMCPTACKWHPTSYKWKQLTSNPKTVKWTSHELTFQDMKIQFATGKHLQTYKQLLKDVWTASANRTGKPWQLFPTQLLQAAQNWQLLLFLGRLMQWKTCTSNNKNASKCKNHWCTQVQMTCKPLQSHFLDLCCKSLKSRLLKWPWQRPN